MHKENLYKTLPHACLNNCQPLYSFVSSFAKVKIYSKIIVFFNLLFIFFPSNYPKINIFTIIDTKFSRLSHNHLHMFIVGRESNNN
jgi:hypothetical protein